MTFSIKDFFSKCDQIRRKLRIWLHLLRKFLMENFIFYVVHFLMTLSDRLPTTMASFLTKINKPEIFFHILKILDNALFSVEVIPIKTKINQLTCF